MAGKRRGRPLVDDFLLGYSVRLRSQTIDAINQHAKLADMEPRTWLREVIERALLEEERRSETEALPRGDIETYSEMDTFRSNS